jgi:hypothetical protein
MVYKNYEIYLETDIQSGFNSGLFLRSTESGYAYQIELTGGQATTDLMVEAIKPLSAQGRTTRFAELWKTTGWNSVRVRITGDDPHIICWLNDTQIWTSSPTTPDRGGIRRPYRLAAPLDCSHQRSRWRPQSRFRETGRFHPLPEHSHQGALT